MSEAEESYEEHVQQNNSRLVSIATNLREPGHFAAACSELTQWCSDPRAFTAQFEDNLLSALQIAVENGTKDGFDFTLAHQLITCCFQHRKLLSKESAVRINRWYEQYRRIKKNGGKRKRKPDPPVDPGGGGPAAGGLEQITVTDSGCTSSMWPQGGPMAGAAQMTSPGYPGAMPGMMPGYPGMPQGAAGPFPPMDPTGARAAAAAAAAAGGGPYPEGYDHQTMLRHRQMMMAQHMNAQQQQQRRAAAAGMPGAQGYPEGMYPIPMGANSVPGQTQPLLRMPAGQAGQHGYPAAMMAGRGGGLMSPGYPPGSNHQMIKASPPVLFSNLQQQPQSQTVMSYPNPHMMPPPYSHDQHSIIMMPVNGHFLVPAFTPPEGVNQYQTSFVVPPEMFTQLGGAHLELQLKSYSSQDDTGSHRTLWPTRPGTNELAIQILINGQLIPIAKDRSTFVKRFVVKGENKLEIHTIPLPYKHYYQIMPVQMVHTAKFIEEVFATQNRRGMNSDHFKQRLLAKGNGNTVVIPLNDAKTNKRLLIPARCNRCQHSNCFDLRDFLQQQFECGTFICPIPGCSLSFQFHELEVDSFVGDIIRQATANNASATEVILEQNGCYRLSDGQHQPQQQQPESVGRKRPSDDGNSAQSLKRIKSEQFPCSSSSPFPQQMVNSVPGGMPLGHSPATNMMSPFGQHNISPKKEIMSPPVGVGAGTPQPSVKEEPQPLPGASTLTSPHGHPVANNGSVDSVNGSAPYTPASMNGTSTTQTQQQQVEAQNTSLTLLESDVDPFRPDDSFSAAEMIKYLQDGDIHSGCHKYELNDQTLTDMQDILNRESMRVWGLSLREIERQLPPLLLPCSNN